MLGGQKFLAMVLAGGKGKRLHPLTAHRAKPAVPFGSIYRLIDFVLSNLVNSGIHQIYILTQYKSHSLLRHLQQGWVGTHPLNGFFIMPVPAEMRTGETWYLGTADAVFQNAYLIRRLKPDLVLIFGADHVYLMDVRQMIEYHLEKGAEVTIATIPMPLSQCHQFGVTVVDKEWRVRRFEEKVSSPTPIPHRPDQALVSMGNYIFDTAALLEELTQDAEDGKSSHDFGRDILPRICEKRKVYAYDFHTNLIPGDERSSGYWRDVGTIESYYRTNMDLKAPLPQLNLYNNHWPVKSAKYHDPPRQGGGGQLGKDGICGKLPIRRGEHRFWRLRKGLHHREKRLCLERCMGGRIDPPRQRSGRGGSKDLQDDHRPWKHDRARRENRLRPGKRRLTISRRRFRRCGHPAEPFLLKENLRMRDHSISPPPNSLTKVRQLP